MKQEEVRKCSNYTCENKINGADKFFCCQDCQDKYWNEGKYGTAKKNNIPVKEMQRRVLEMGKNAPKKEKDIIDVAQEIFG